MEKLQINVYTVLFIHIYKYLFSLRISFGLRLDKKINFRLMATINSSNQEERN